MSLRCRVVLPLAMCTLFSGAALAQNGEIIEFKGSTSTVTPEFEVQAPWILDWRVLSDFPNSLSIEVALLDSRTGMHKGQVIQSKAMGSGVKLFDAGGKYKLRIDSDLVRWQFLIKEVSGEEAEQYQPRNEGLESDKWFRKRDN